MTTSQEGLASMGLVKCADTARGAQWLQFYVGEANVYHSFLDNFEYSYVD